MSLSRRDFPQILQSVYDEDTKALRVEGDITVSNPSVGDNGATAPTSSDQVAGQDPSGNLQPVQLDANKNLKTVANIQDTAGNALTSTSGALNVLSVGGSLVPDKYDSLVLTYVASGAGVGQVQTVAYSLSGTQIGLLTLSYDGSNNLTSVVRS